MKQTFPPSKELIGVFAFGLLLTLGLSVYAISIQQLLPSLIFIGFTLLCLYRLWVTLRSSISIDDEGLWLSRLGKSGGLVKWQQITAVHIVRDNGLLLYNHQGKQLLKLQYHLNHFSQLYEELLAHITLARPYPTTFKLGVLHHASYLFFMFIFPVVLLWSQRDAFGSEWQQWIIWIVGLLLLLAMFLNRYLREVYHIEINDDIIKLYYPLRHKILPIVDIESVGYNHFYAPSEPFRTVVLSVKNRKKTIALRTGNNPLGLYHAIKQRIN